MGFFVAKPSFEAFCSLLRTEPTPTLDTWFEASAGLPSKANLHTLATAFRWANHADELHYRPREEWPQALIEDGLLQHQTETLLNHLRDITPVEHPELFLKEAFWREVALLELDTHNDDHFANALLSNADTLLACLSTIREPRHHVIAETLFRVFPELVALRYHRADHVTDEHESTSGSAPLPLLEHLVDRSLARKLRGLERADIACFQRDDALGQAAFDAEVAVVQSLESAGLMPLLRAALMFLDFAKGGTDEARDRWRQTGVDLSIHNEAAARILAQNHTLRRFPRLRAAPVLEQLVIELVRVHGLTGQVIRGECPLTVFEPFTTWLRHAQPQLAQAFGLSHPHTIDLVIDLLHVLNLCDTAGVREGLFTDALRFEFVAVENLLRRVSRSSTDEIARALQAFDAPTEDTEPRSLQARQRQWLTDRLTRLRQSRIKHGEPVQESIDAVNNLSSEALMHAVKWLANCQLWYVEAATSSLTASSQLKLLICAITQSNNYTSIDTSKMYHITFLPLVRELGRSDHAASYRVRLVEALLRRLDIEAVVRGADPMPDDALGSFEVELGGGQAIAVRFEASAEATALLTLLPTYEKKSSAAFHATLKTLCDLYGLRKDDFDRLANENTYLQHMNDARSDKERMLDHARAGCIVEIGPGGGVVLDLIEARFPTSRVVGVDVSRLVVETLQQKREREKKRWTVIEADAFELDAHFEPGTVTTVVLCSVLHEIYSYVEYPVDGVPRRFRLESVRDLLRACYRTLAPGGRIIIRDGIMPLDEPRIIEFIDPDGPEFFRLFQEQFEGRPICGEWLDEKRVRLGAADAMEFLYCYTWGPASFPYEVREQYGVLPYDEYLSTILAWLAHESPSARAIELPPAQASYLQQGYIDGLAPKIRLYDAQFQAVALPDSNAILVIEKPG